MIEDKILTVELELQKIEEKEGRFTFVSKSLSKDFECEKGRAVLSKESKGKHLIWRHKHPLNDKSSGTHIYGNVLDSWLEDGEIYSEYEVYDHTNEHKAIIEVIKERHRIGEPLGISMRYRRYSENGVPVHYDVFEHSGTPYPKCLDCKEITIGVNTMTNEEEKIKEETKLEEAFKKINEMEAVLNSKAEIMNELKVKTEALEKEMKVKDAKLEDKEIAEKTLEDKVADLLNEVSKLKRKPIIDKILEVRKLDEIELEMYNKQSMEYLQGKYKEFSKEKNTTKDVETKTQSQTSADAIKATDEELEKKAPSFKEFVKLTGIKIKKEKSE